MERADVLIVGGGPAGSACARVLVDAGRDALVVDACAFPRRKPCAGWITREALAELPFTLAEYAVGHTLQPFTGFLVSRVGGRGVRVDYREPVSYGIRRDEFDHELLRRSRARVIEGERVTRVERRGSEWVLNGRLAAPVLVGAGGHFCPVAQHVAGRVRPTEIVVTREAEYLLEGKARPACRIDPECPELYFSPDLRGYGWCVRKGGYLNVGFGRRDRRRLVEHMNRFLAFVTARGRIDQPPCEGWRGHAYRLRDSRPSRLVGDGLLLAGDAAGMAAPSSGEGILPALVSGRLAGEAILAAGPDGSEARLARYVRDLGEQLGLPARAVRLPGPVARLAGAALLAYPPFVRRIVLDRWFLHRYARV
jgi:flavin-dependent dehydrogenase